MTDATDAALDRMAERAEPELVVEAIKDGSVRGVFEAYAMAPGHAEVALSVEDECQGRRLGRALFMEGLRALAERGFRTADLFCLRENAAVLALVRAAGGRIRLEGGEAVVQIELGRVLGEAAFWVDDHVAAWMLGRRERADGGCVLSPSLTLERIPFCGRDHWTEVAPP